jgi:hypothetical protein
MLIFFAFLLLYVGDVENAFTFFLFKEGQVAGIVIDVRIILKGTIEK